LITILTQLLRAPELCYLQSNFTTTFDKLLLCVQYLFGEHYPVLTGSCFIMLGDFNLSLGQCEELEQ